MTVIDAYNAAHPVPNADKIAKEGNFEISTDDIKEYMASDEDVFGQPIKREVTLDDLAAIALESTDENA